MTVGLSVEIMALRDYHYRRLDDMQKGAYVAFKSALLAHKKRITIFHIDNLSL